LDVDARFLVALIAIEPDATTTAARIMGAGALREQAPVPTNGTAEHPKDLPLPNLDPTQTSRMIAMNHKIITSFDCRILACDDVECPMGTHPYSPFDLTACA